MKVILNQNEKFTVTIIAQGIAQRIYVPFHFSNKLVGVHALTRRIRLASYREYARWRLEIVGAEHPENRYPERLLVDRVNRLFVVVEVFF
ncbi:hypothetical protein N8198_06050 [Gammaproteobacteria bacterium]|nr:hypothetical protein [Gammaproteobacteria bacterium]